MDAKDVIILARKHAVFTESEMNSSARVALADAVMLYDDGNFDAAKTRALKSLAYSVGILHDDYINACKGDRA